MEGAMAASDFMRYTARSTFDRMGRSMLANDILVEIPRIVKEIDCTAEGY
jgi:NAD(P)H-hydrate repair Nnr-like enzyme with NAD(P)H-hydrate dehydratase domain